MLGARLSLDGSLAAHCVCPVQRGKGAGEESGPPSGIFWPEPLP